MEKEIEHRGYKIKSGSYQDEEGKWIPQAFVVPSEDTQNQPESPLTWPKEFDSQEEADSYALQSAQLYIDNKF